MIKLTITVMVTIFLVGCGDVKPPHEVYMEFIEKERQKVPFGEHVKYFSKNKVEEVEGQFPRYMKSMNKTKAEVIEFYLSLSQKIAQCSEFKLIENKAFEENATLVYEVKDICNKPANTFSHIVKFSKTNNWKIEDILTKI